MHCKWIWKMWMKIFLGIIVLYYTNVNILNSRFALIYLRLVINVFLFLFFFSLVNVFSQVNLLSLNLQKPCFCISILFSSFINAVSTVEADRKISRYRLVNWPGGLYWAIWTDVWQWCTSIETDFSCGN